MALPQKKPEVHPADVMEGLIIKGDLEGLTPEQRLVYYHRVCESGADLEAARWAHAS